MIEKIEEKVSVNFIYNHVTGETSPKRLKWKNRVYDIQKVGLHYTVYRGNALFHLFAVACDDHFFLLSFNSHTLHWRLEEVADSAAN